MFPHMCPVYIILHGNPLLWTPNPPITSRIHQTFIEQFPGAPDGWVSACTQLPLATPASVSPHLAAGGFGWLGRRHISVVYVKVPTLVWLRGIRVHETVSSASLPVQRASLQTQAVCSENNEEGMCWGGRRIHRNVKPWGDGDKKQVPGPPPARDRILGQHSLGGRGLSCEKLAGQRRGESGRGRGKQLAWLSSQWGDAARLISSPRGRSRGR